jgi:hypothetical protein
MRQPIALAAALALVVALFIIGSQPEAAGLIGTPWDKFAHGAYFGAIALCGWWGTRGRWPALIVLAVIALTSLDEWHQATLPGRNPSIIDGVVGSAAATLIIALLWWSRRNPVDFPPKM